MTKKQATKDARKAANENGVPVVVVIEGPAADDFARYDRDGNSYGYCPEAAKEILYRHGVMADTIQPDLPAR